MNDLVSIVLPVYNGERYLKESIDSIISQTYQNWELIIVDDCSSDNSPVIAKHYEEKDNRIKYYRNEQNIKLPRSLNKGFSIAKGNYLTWTSDDNMYLPEALSRMVNELEKNQVDFVFATCDVINETGEIVEVWAAPRDYQTAIMKGDFVGACFLYTRKVYETIGEYDANKFLVEDYDYWLRIFCRFKVYNITEHLYRYRWHKGSLTSTEKQDGINSMCERVLWDNIGDYGKLSLKQKYYFYAHLHKLRQSKETKAEKNKYKTKAKLLEKYYLFFYRIPNKIRRTLKHNC